MTSVKAPWPSAIAVMRALPSETAVTTPVGLTRATAGLSDCQDTARSVTGRCCRSRTAAVNIAVSPGDSERVVGERLTAATAGAITVAVAAPVMPSLRACTRATPAPVAEIIPLASTDTTLGSLVDQSIVRPPMIAPPRSASVAATRARSPTESSMVPGVT